MTRQAYDLISEGFGPGANGPLVIAAELPGASAKPAIQQLAVQLRGEEGIAFVGRPQFNGAGVVSSAPEVQGTLYATSVYVIRATEASALGFTTPAPLGLSGVTVDGTTVLFGITFKSDSNLDGRVDGDFRIFERHIFLDQTVVLSTNFSSLF